MQTDHHVCNGIGHFDCALTGRAVLTIRCEDCAFKYSLADDPMVPRNWLPARIETCGNAVVSHRTVPATANVIFPGPNYLDGCLHFLSNLHGFYYKFRGRAATASKTTSKKHSVKLHLAGRESCQLYRSRTIQALELSAGVDLGGVGA